MGIIKGRLQIDRELPQPRILTDDEWRAKGYTVETFPEAFMSTDSKTNTRQGWPGNRIACEGDNLRIHDELCDMLVGMGFSESDVVNASVGIWGGMQAMKEHLEPLPTGTNPDTDRIEQIRTRMQAASRGPWRSMRDGNQYLDGDRNKLVGASRVDGLKRPWNPWFVKSALELESVSRFKDEDADFIANAREDIHWLLEQLSLKQQVDNGQTG
jgi:hypothetical protein